MCRSSEFVYLLVGFVDSLVRLDQLLLVGRVGQLEHGDAVDTVCHFDGLGGVQEDLLVRVFARDGGDGVVMEETKDSRRQTGHGGSRESGAEESERSK